MIIQVCKKDNPYLVRHYHNNPAEMVKAGDGIVWTADKIRSAFNFGNGTEKDLRRYIENNKCFCAFYDTEKGTFI